MASFILICRAQREGTTYILIYQMTSIHLKSRVGLVAQEIHSEEVWDQAVVICLYDDSI